jgi:hypothetical protein
MNYIPYDKPIPAAKQRANALRAIGGDTPDNRAYLDSVRREIAIMGINAYTDKSLADGLEAKKRHAIRLSGNRRVV